MEAIVDPSSFFEIGANWGTSMPALLSHHEIGSSCVTGLARLHGYSVGVLASDPTHLAGALDASSCEKMMRHIKMCSLFHIPIINFVDCPGFLIGRVAEEEATIRKGAELLAVMYETRIPIYTCIVRKCFGVGGAALAISDIRVGWPSGDWGSLPLEGGIEAGFRRQLQNSPNFAKMRAELENKLEAVRSPIRTAEIFGIPEIIDPRSTRRRMCDWAETVYHNVLPQMLVNRSKL